MRWGGAREKESGVQTLFLTITHKLCTIFSLSAVAIRLPLVYFVERSLEMDSGTVSNADLVKDYETVNVLN